MIFCLKWREPYDQTELAALQSLITAADHRQIDFIYAISPGLDIEYGAADDLTSLTNKLDQMVVLGCRQFALLCDDIPARLSPTDEKQFGSFAAAQAALACRVLEHLQENKLPATLLFCPTIYCGRMADFKVRESAYLRELGEKLPPEVAVFWTGPEVVSAEISVASVQEVAAVIRRKPVIWDNLHANDYDLHRMFVGPYAGRSLALRNEITGILSNPNCQFWANYIPLKSLALYVQAENTWAPDESYRRLIPDWLACFGEHEFTTAELELLGDCFYLPTELGQKARQVLQDLESNPSSPTLPQFSRTVNEMYEKIARISNRDLFHSLHSFFWELRRAARIVEQQSQTERRDNGNILQQNYLPDTASGGFINQLHKQINF